MTSGQDKLKQEIEKQIGNFKPDNLIEFIKMLHCDIDTEQFYNSDEFVRDQVAFGVTKQDAAQQFGVDERTIFNMISQLDPDRRFSGTEPYYIAGQSINIKINEKRIDNKRLKQLDESVQADRRVRFCSESTVHPVFLQLNVTQLGALIRALSVDYAQYRSFTTLGLGAYIYSQLSPYAIERVIKVFAKQDEDIERFIDHMDNLREDDIAIGFKTESDVAQMPNLKVDIDLLTMYVKNGWKCDVTISEPEGETTYKKAIISDENGFVLKTSMGKKISIIPDNILCIKHS